MVERKRILEMKSIRKRYGETQALDNVDFDLFQGEVHCLVGENGAGKSTLIKILSGAEHPTTGSIGLWGDNFSSLTPDLALSLGVATIYQDVELISSLTVADNIFLGHERTKARGLVNYKEQKIATEKLLDSLNIDIPADEIVERLPPAKQQMLQIVKALHHKAKILIMDEPTVSLGIEETEALMKLVRQLVAQGISIIYISHYLDEVFELGDRVTVLKDGKKVGTYLTSEVDQHSLANKMVGRDRSAFFERPKVPIGETVLEVKNLSASSLVQNVSFELRRGEILGFGGIVGAGRSELMRCLFGVDPAVTGSITFNGKVVTTKKPSDAIDCGLAMVPEDRKKDGLFMSRPILENISVLKNEEGRLVLDRAGEKGLVDRLIDSLSIATSSVFKPVGQLSGGNQQKVAIARWLESEAQVFIFDEPTKGVDIGAKRQIYELIVELVRRGNSILMVSSDMAELMSMSDRIAIMRGGTITSIVDADSVNEQSLVEGFLGISEKRGETNDPA